MKLPRPRLYLQCAEPQPLAAALQASRDLRERKQRDSNAWLAARKVVKLPGVKKPTGHQDPTYELPKKGPGKGWRLGKGKQSKEERKRRKREAAAASRAKKARAEGDGGDTSAPAPAPAPKKPRKAPKKRKEHPLRAKVKEKKRRK